jgi:hypothetical protein
MSELAFNINGESFEVPAQATGWRVRRMRVKGSPEVVYGRDGLPLVLPIDAELDDLRAEVDVTGRYRLDLVDQHNKAITDVPSGYVQINTQQAPGNTTSTSGSSQAFSDNPMIEAMRINADLAKTVVDRFPQMMEAAAVLLRAADGAGLPARKPHLLAELTEADSDPEDDDQDDEGSTAGSPTIELINTLVAQVIPIVLTSLTSGKKLPKLASVLDWRKAVPATDDDASAAESDAREDDALALDPKMMGHLIAIQSALAPAEAALARQLVAELSPAEMRAWMKELCALSIPDAVAKVRSILGSKKAGVS